MSTIWTLVADASRGRIFEAEGPNAPLHETITLTHPASRQHEGDLISDRPGHVMSSAGGGHNFGGDKETKHEEAEHFAREICQRLEQGHNEDSFHKLYVVAAPHFLGLLRQHMAKPVQQLIAAEIDKDIVTADAAEVRAHLPEHL